jgi:hypothetical protein
MLVGCVWLLGLAFGMVLPGPDGSSLPTPLRAVALAASAVLFFIPEASAWPLARLLTGEPPGWAESLRSARGRLSRLAFLRAAILCASLALLTVAGVSAS